MSTIFEHGYALIVSVDANQIPRLALPAVAKDVQAVYEVMIHPDRCAYNPENVKFLKGDQSTRDNILDGLYWLQGKVKGDPEATAVIYYSGHGMVDKVTDQYYLIPYNIGELSRIRQFALKAEDLTAEISAVQAKRMLAIFDCCHAAGMEVKDIDLAAIDSASAVEAAPFPLDLPQTKNIPNFEAEPGAKNVSDLLDGEGRAVLNSSTGSQSSYVRTDGAMSLFTYHLVEALTGHAPHPDDATVVYVTDVMSWVTHQVKKSAREQNRDQTPVMRTSGVFPIAQLIGGQGVAKGMGQLPPDPLAPLPPASTTHVEGSMVVGSVDTGGGDFSGRDLVKKEGGVHTDGGFNMSGGSFVGGDNRVVHGDEVHGDKVGGDKVAGDKISVGSILNAPAAHIAKDATASFIGGDEVGGDKISVGDISNSQGIAIGAGAMVHNETHHHYYGQSDEDESPKIEEAIRLDTAAPAEVFKKQPFDIAVAVRQPDSPQLVVEDLPVVVSESGSVFRSEAAEIIQYRIEVSGKDFVVKPESYTLKLRPGVDSRVCFFQVTPLKSGKKSLLINAYQESDVVAAQTRIQLAVAVKVSSETQFLRFLVGQLEVFLHAAPPEQASVVKELKVGVNLLIQMSADSPNPVLLKMMGDGLAGSSQKLEADSPGIIESLERVVTAVVAMADSQT